MTEASDESPELGQLAEKLLSRPVKADLMAYCPTMDLLALATTEERVYVYRLNGQRVIGAANKRQGLTVKNIHWKPNGQLLAVAWSDNAVRLISPENSKIIHEIYAAREQQYQVTFLSWAINFTKDVKEHNGASHQDLEHILSQTIQTHAPEALPDLPKILALLDIEGSLPKLSLLPSGRDEDVFSFRATLDSMFHPLQPQVGQAVDVLFVGLDDGKFHLSIYNRFEIGVFDIGRVSGRLQGCRPILHASHPYSATHTLLVSQKGSTIFLPVDLRFFSSTGEYLPLLAAKSTQLQNLLRYINQVQRIISADWKACQDLPSKFIRVIDDALNVKHQCGFIQAAYQLVVTGNCLPPLKEWLVDVLQERGHKRWEKAVSAGYESIRRLAHENLLPALERCAVVVSRLRGLSNFHSSDSPLGLSSRHLNDVLDGISCLNLLAHNIVKYAGLELRQFLAFSSWLRYEIDVQAADPTSTAEDPAEKERDIDYAKVLDYIQGPMMNSLIAKLVAVSPLQAASVTTPPEGFPIYARFKEDLKKMTTGFAADQDLLGLGAVNIYLEYHCGVVFQRIAESQRRNVLFGSPHRLVSKSTESATAMRMLFEASTDTTSITYVVIKSFEYPNKLCVFRVSLRIFNGLSAFLGIDVALLALATGKIEDVKFVDDESMMVLWTNAECSKLLSVPYNLSSGKPACLKYQAWHQEGMDMVGQDPFTHVPTIPVSDEEVTSTYARHVFRVDSFKPARLEINGRKGRRVVCVLSKDGLRYKIFDIGGDAAEESSDGQNEEGDSADGDEEQQGRDDDKML